GLVCPVQPALDGTPLAEEELVRGHEGSDQLLVRHALIEVIDPACQLRSVRRATQVTLIIRSDQLRLVFLAGEESLGDAEPAWPGRQPADPPGFPPAVRSAAEQVPIERPHPALIGAPRPGEILGG